LLARTALLRASLAVSTSSDATVNGSVEDVLLTIVAGKHGSGIARRWFGLRKSLKTDPLLRKLDALRGSQKV
jgi:hypothetical protein